jgi:hypothetical protein
MKLYIPIPTTQIIYSTEFMAIIIITLLINKKQIFFIIIFTF